MRERFQHVDVPLTIAIGLVFVLMAAALMDSAWSPFTSPAPDENLAEPRVVYKPVPYQPIAPQVWIERARRSTGPGSTTEIRYAPIPKRLEVRKREIIQQREAARQRSEARPRPKPPRKDPEPKPPPKDDGDLVMVCVTDICIEASALGGAQ